MECVVRSHSLKSFKTRVGKALRAGREEPNLSPKLARKALYKLANPPSWSKKQWETWSQKPLEDLIPPRQGLEMVPGLGEVLPW